MVPLLNIVDLMPILEGTLVAPTVTIPEPPIPTGTPATGTTPAMPPTSDDWSMYNAQLKRFERFEKATEKYLKRRGEAHGVLNQSLDLGIWEQVKSMDPATAWTWLRTTFSTQQFVEILEDFKILTAFKFDLSDPAIQLPRFRFHYTRIPVIPAVAGPPAIPAIPYVSDSMAALILLSALPQSSDPAQDSVYTRMMEEYTSSHSVPNMTLDTLDAAIRHTWASRFGGILEKDRPKKGTFYLTKKTGSQEPQGERRLIVTVPVAEKHCDQGQGQSPLLF